MKPYKIKGLGSGIVCELMEKQEMKVERNLEKETGNRTENEKCWHRICLLHRLMCSVFLYCALDYLAMVMSLQCEKKSVVLTHFGYLSFISFSA